MSTTEGITEVQYIDNSNVVAAEENDFGPSALDIAKDVMILLLSGIAVLIGLVVLVYLTTVLFDRYCCCCPWFTPVTPQEELILMERRQQQDRQHRKAGLWGLSESERKSILEFLFPKTLYSSAKYKSQNNEQQPTKEQQKDQGLSATTKTDGNEEEQLSKMEEGLGTIAILPPLSQLKESKQEEAQKEGEKAEEQNDETQKEEVQKEEAHKEEAQQEETQQDEAPQETDEAQQELDEGYKTTCSICLLEYEEGASILTSAKCQHFFHYECAMEWLHMQGREDCPYCRKPMMTPAAMRSAAKEVLSEARFRQVSAVPKITSTVQEQEQQQPQSETTTGPSANVIELSTMRENTASNANRNNDNDSDNDNDNNSNNSDDNDNDEEIGATSGVVLGVPADCGGEPSADSSAQEYCGNSNDDDDDNNNDNESTKNNDNDNDNDDNGDNNNNGDDHDEEIGGPIPDDIDSATPRVDSPPPVQEHTQNGNDSVGTDDNDNDSDSVNDDEEERSCDGNKDKKDNKDNKDNCSVNDNGSVEDDKHEDDDDDDHVGVDHVGVDYDGNDNDNDKDNIYNGGDEEIGTATILVDSTA